MDDKHSIEIKPRLPSPTVEASLELGRKLITETFESYKDFSKTLISLSSGFIPLYLGIVAFLGIHTEEFGPKGMTLVILPPVFFITSCVFYIISYFPRVNMITLDNPDELTNALEHSLKVKRRYIITGSFFFTAGLVCLVVALLYFVILRS